jgi:hypothetical protein
MVKRHIMNVAGLTRIALGVMAFTIACASSQGRTSETPPAPTASTATAPGEGGGSTSPLERYVGTYQISPQLTAVIRLQGTTLIREMNGQQTVLTPISATRFRAGAGELEFETDQGGRVMMVLRHGTETMRIPRRR